MTATELPRRPLGRTGLMVSALGYGSMELRGEPRGRQLDEGQVGRLLARVLDLGIDLIDTSIDYGVAEERIGRHLASRRDEFVLASKCGCVVGWEPSTPEERSPHDYRPENIIAGVEQSLRRLRTDRLDVLQVHLSPSRTELEACDVIETMRELQRAGSVRFLGMSGTLPHLADHLEMDVFDVVQVPYSLLQPEHGELLRRAADRDVGVIVRGGAGKGAPSGERRAVERNTRLAARWERIARDILEPGEPPMAFVLRHTLSDPGVTSAVVGTASLGHLEANVAAAAAGPLPAERIEAVRDRLAALADE